ncbi:hypothetical protein M422DRAFT_248328, partial [Sphaerobolus stellatus SS14]
PTIPKEPSPSSLPTLSTLLAASARKLAAARKKSTSASTSRNIATAPLLTRGRSKTIPHVAVVVDVQAKSNPTRDVAVNAKATRVGKAKAKQAKKLVLKLQMDGQSELGGGAAGEHGQAANGYGSGTESEQDGRNVEKEVAGSVAPSNANGINMKRTKVG